MNEFFGSIYELFARLGLYGTGLEMYLYGFECNTGAFTGEALYASMGFYMILCAAISALLFYKIIDHPRFNRWYHWLIMMGINALALFLIPYIRLKDHLDIGRICVDLFVQNSDIVGFAISNLILGVFLYIVFSLGLRFWSRNASCTPYPL